MSKRTRQEQPPLAKDGIVDLLGAEASFWLRSPWWTFSPRRWVREDIHSCNYFWIHPIPLGFKVTLFLYLFQLIGLVLGLLTALDRNCCSLHAWNVASICA